MKKVMLFLILLLLVPAVVAKGTAPGIVPSSLFWKADLFFERVNIALTFDSAEKIRLHLLHAGERLAEAAADADSAELALNERANELNAAHDLFAKTDVTAALATDVRAQLAAQTNVAAELDDAEEALDQQAELEIAVAAYDVEDVETVATETVAPITAAVTVDTEEREDDIDEKTIEPEITDESEPSADVPLPSDNLIRVTIEDADLAYVHVYINGIEKEFALATGHPPAIIKEISKRTFLTIEEVEAITIFSGP